MAFAVWTGAGHSALRRVFHSAAASILSNLKTLNPDNDGTVDLTEAKTSAGKLFNKLDHDHDGTLDRRELRGRLNGKDFGAADPDNDGTVDKNEFLAIGRLTQRSLEVLRVVPAASSEVASARC